MERIEVNDGLELSNREVRDALRKCVEIQQDEAFQPGSQSPYLEALMVLLLINVKDVLIRADKDGCRVDFSDDIDKVPGKIDDVTDLICSARNVACHIFSDGKQIAEGSRLSFAFMRGYCPDAISIGDLHLGNPYHDDVAVYFGRYRFYLHRHLIRAVNQLVEIYGLEY